MRLKQEPFNRDWQPGRALVVLLNRLLEGKLLALRRDRVLPSCGTV